MKRIALLLLVASCGGNDNPGQVDAAVDGPGGTIDAPIDTPSMTGPFTLTSPVLTEGAAIMQVNTCDGGNTSPQLVWSGDSKNAMAFAVVLTDTTNGVVHWVIYDIPANLSGLPANVEKVYAPMNVMGAHQTTSYQNVRGYLGPCPQSGSGVHIYEFAVYGVDVVPLPNTAMGTTRAQALPIITMHQTAVAKLTGTYMR
jgi:Raf kinase inhibitor-like YbhB/YbcL family protein